MGVRSFVLTGRGRIGALKVSKPYDTTKQRERIITLRRDLTNMNKGTAAVRNTDDDTRDSWPYRIATGMGNQCGPQSTPSGVVQRRSDGGGVEHRTIQIPSRFAVDRIEFSPDE